MSRPLFCLVSAILLQNAATKLVDSDELLEDLEPSDIDRNLKIVNGKDVHISQYPYAVSVQRHGQQPPRWIDQWVHECTGTLIGLRWVLTAAHCNIKEENGGLNEIRVVLGATNININGKYKPGDGAQEIKIRHIHRHPNARPVPNHNRVFDTYDPFGISLLELDHDVRLHEGSVIPVTLVREGSAAFATVRKYWSIVTGFGWGIEALRAPFHPLLRFYQAGYTSGCTRISHPNFICFDYLDYPKRSFPCYGDEGGGIIVQVASPSGHMPYYWVMLAMNINGPHCSENQQQALRVTLFCEWFEQITGIQFCLSSLV
ncbi:unnamed protein product, partial [Mesorhabditis spiculigera]